MTKQSAINDSNFLFQSFFICLCSLSRPGTPVNTVKPCCDLRVKETSSATITMWLRFWRQEENSEHYLQRNTRARKHTHTHAERVSMTWSFELSSHLYWLDEGCVTLVQNYRFSWPLYSLLFLYSSFMEIIICVNSYTPYDVIPKDSFRVYLLRSVTILEKMSMNS